MVEVPRGRGPLQEITWTGEKTGKGEQSLVVRELLQTQLFRLFEKEDVAQRKGLKGETQVAPNYPLVGSDAFRTGTGVHAAAIIKAQAKGHHWLADRIYSGVPAGMFGCEQDIEIGHQSGESNVIYWLKKRHIDPEPELVSRILKAAKTTNRLLAEEEILMLAKTQNDDRGVS